MKLSLPVLRRPPERPPVQQWPEDLRVMPAATATELDVPMGIRLAAAYSWRLLIIGAAVYVLAWGVGHFSEITIPFFIAVLLSALLHPVRDLMTRKGIPRGLATAITMIGTLAVLIGLIALTGTQLVNGMGQLSTEVTKGLENIQEWLRTGPLHLSSGQLQNYLDTLQQQLTQNREKLVSLSLSGASTAGGVLTGLVLSLFCLIFLLHDGRGVWNWIVGLLPEQGRGRADLAGRRGWVTVTSYVRATMIVAATDAIGIAVGAAILGVPLAIPIGVLTFLAAFIPMIGAILSGGVAVLVALVALGFGKALIMLGVVIAVQQLESHVLQPFLMGRAVHLHPLGVVLSLGAGFVVAGIVGGVFAVPLMAFLNTVRHSLQDNVQQDSARPDAASDAPLAVDPARPRPAEELTDAALAQNSEDDDRTALNAGSTAMGSPSFSGGADRDSAGESSSRGTSQ